MSAEVPHRNPTNQPAFELPADWQTLAAPLANPGGALVLANPAESLIGGTTSGARSGMTEISKFKDSSEESAYLHIPLDNVAPTILLAAAVVGSDPFVDTHISTALTEGTTVNGASLGVANLLAGTTIHGGGQSIPDAVMPIFDKIRHMPNVDVLLLSKLMWEGPEAVQRAAESILRNEEKRLGGREVYLEVLSRHNGSMLSYLEARGPTRPGLRDEELKMIGHAATDEALNVVVNDVLSQASSGRGRRAAATASLNQLLRRRADETTTRTGEREDEDTRVAHAMAADVDAERNKPEGKTLIISENPGILMAAYAGIPGTREIHVRGASVNQHTRVSFESAIGVRFSPKPAYEKYARQYQRIVCTMPHIYEPAVLLNKLGKGGHLILSGNIEDPRYIEDVLQVVRSQNEFLKLQSKGHTEWKILSGNDADVAVTISQQTQQVDSTYASSGNRYSTYFVFRAPAGLDYALLTNRISSEAGQF